MVELREARKIASSSGLGLQYVLKEARVFDIWGKLSPLIMSEKVKSKANIVSKGGTALNKIYLSGVQRFSEDLDLTPSSKEARQEAIRSSSCKAN